MSARTKHMIGFALSLILAAASALVRWHPEYTGVAAIAVALVTDLGKAFGGDVPPVGAVLLFAAVALGGVACAHVPAPVVNTLTCAEHSADIAALLPRVAQDLAADDYGGALATVMQDVGIGLVKCAVREFLREHASDVDASSDPLTTRQVANGNAWMAAH